jgi:hypothetical protein
MVATSGCGGQKSARVTGETTSTQKALQLKTVGYAKGDVGYTITGLLYNPEKEMGAIDTTITVTIYDTNGVIQVNIVHSLSFLPDAKTRQESQMDTPSSYSSLFHFVSPPTTYPV